MCTARRRHGGAHRWITEGASRTSDVREAGSREGMGGGMHACMHCSKEIAGERMYIRALAGLYRCEVQ